MRQKGVSFFCLSLVMCAIVGLQFVNHFVMVRKQDSECACNCKEGAQGEVRKRNLKTEPRYGDEQRTFDEYVDGLLAVLNDMKGEKNQLGENLDALSQHLNKVKDSRKDKTSSTKLHEKIKPTEQAQAAEIQEICPEKFLGTSLTYGYPFFRKGFSTINCTQYVPVEDLVTIVFDDVYTAEVKPPAYMRVLKGVAKYFPKINVVYVTSNKPPEGIDQVKSKVKVIRVPKDVTQGKMWLDSLAHVTTKYVLIAPNLVTFDDDVNLKRLLRLLSHNPDVAIAAGAYRTRSGHWDIGCQQSIFRNYTLTLQGGYYRSFLECVVCDFVPGPWVARTEELKKLKFDKSLHFGALYDIFWKMKKEKNIAVSCPDVMFNINPPKTQDAYYLEFARKYDIKKIIEPNGQVRWYGCRRGIQHRTGGSCLKRKGVGVPPCDLENLADAVKLIMGECEKAGLFCELQEGTLLGAVKFNGILPWERDADLTFLTANYTAFKKLQPIFTDAGYSFSAHDQSIWCCVDGRKAGGKISMSGDGWGIELYGQHLMESEMLVARGESPTKVNFAGQMVTVMRNPGLFARNRYGRSIYRHQEHWMDRGKRSGWHFYNPGKFEECAWEGHSGCLSEYSIDGNMQFERNTCPCTVPLSPTQ